MQGTVFLTGATGFLGTRILEELMTTTDVVVYALVRAHSKEDALVRLEDLWWEQAALKDALGTRIVPIVGDITQPLLGLSSADLEQLTHCIDYAIHSAADVSINKSKSSLWEVNVEGTRNVLDFASQIHSEHPIKRFSHISTAYVAGSRKGLILEDELLDQGFSSLYEHSKYEAELVVSSYRQELPVSIFRPGQIVGDSQTGAITAFNTLYYPLKLYLKGELKLVPIGKNQSVNMVPVDYVAQAVVELSANEAASGRTFHLTIPRDEQASVGDLLNTVRAWAAAHERIKLPRPVFVSAPLLGTLGKRHNLKPEDKTATKSKLSNILALAPYFYEKRSYDTSNCKELLTIKRPHWKEYLDPLLRYAVSKGFLNHNSRTVFEQMQLRLKKSTNQITYFDVSSKEIAKHSNLEITESITRAFRALSALGVKGGDRIALAGTNGTNYLIVDAAIGLLGAVSVPLYYTSPLEEIDLLLKKSGATLFFADTEKILGQVSGLTADVRVISILPRRPESGDIENAGSPAAGSSGVYSGGVVGSEKASTTESAVASDGTLTWKGILAWEDFLACSSDASFDKSSGKNVDQTSVRNSNCTHQTGALPKPSYDDLATIRYTSGTTGQPKGVTFNQYQLKWMAETLPSLLSWKTRNQTIRYLSFLPLSHVVEGILVAYAPYYILSDVEIYYLNEFSQLTETLPKVRPTIFFSVPRFYEKVWEQFIHSGAGKLYLKLDEGIPKNMLRTLSRFVLLRKAGLDKCSQLLVGSAPVSIELLQAFRDLGIEIYNAYGLTEAPLITLSRLGENELGSVGRLLPQTQAAVAEDGEILIKGPQVTSRYDGEDASPLSKEGYFPTGDFGCLSHEGNLIIEGRKKEVLITSYGKNINPQKIETLLKTIPSISEALVLGDSLPYCTALLWIDDALGFCPKTEVLQQEIERINNALSNPEKIKDWVAFTKPLSIAEGELTPNLKVRRNRIIERYNGVIATLYDGSSKPIPHAIRKGATSHEL